MPPAPAEFAASLAHPLGCYYSLAAAANFAAAGMAWRRKNRVKSLIWTLFAIGFCLLGGMAFRGYPLQLSQGLKSAVDSACTPAALNFSFFAFLLLVYFAREFFAKPAVAWIGFSGAILFFGASLADANFFTAAMRPDDVPIVAMIFLLGWFLWLALYQAVENDRRLFSSLPTNLRSVPGEGPRARAESVEKEYSEKVLVWPDLVYSELICMIVFSALLIVWSLLLPAPLEQPANPAITPNPSKAPWYFVGLQELLTFSDAWNVGVVVPALIILGLCAIPYLDRNRAGSGYYSLRGRRFAILVFLFGFLQLWILPILIGTFLRGPNWSSFGLYEVRDPSKLLTLEHFSISQAFWTGLLGRPLPQAPADAGGFTQFLYFLYRDFPGVSLLLLYFLALPPLLGRTPLKRYRKSLGYFRFHSMMFLLLYMLTLPIKMTLYWLFGLDSLFG
ncbi:MAG: hypothetical protein IT426_16845 [Pirellulales bacterium]|nr:hypothetical protein [Pirellulales bacterium]